MKARILNFRRGRRTQYTNQFLVEIEGVESRAMASRFVGKKILWKSPAGKEIRGTLVQPHGNNGVLRARFSKGLPGTVLGKRVELLDK